jgi:ATP-dependent DNA helicase Rep
MLNDQQHEAVRYIDGPLLVLAGAGSGKTRVIAQKIAYLIKTCGYSARHIAAVTFTNKAAREMKERVTQLISGEQSKGLQVSTFHTLGLTLLKREHTHLGYRRGFSIYDASDSLALIKELIRQHEPHLTDLADTIRNNISHWKNELFTATHATSHAQNDLEGACARIYEHYVGALRAYNAVDFDDLISLPTQLLQTNPDIRERWQQRIRYLLVDEYQDTNTCQYQLVQLLIGDRGGLTAVGDDDQSIYAWRGAKPENMRLLTEDYPKLRMIKLEQNYRSMGRILKAANHVIRNNPHIFEKTLWSGLGYGDPIKVVRCRDSDHEAEKLVSLILHHKFQHRTQFGDYAILYRGNHQSKLYEKALRANHIPYRLSGGTSFFDHSEIRDVMAYLRLIINPDDDAAFLRVVNTPRREIGPTTLERLRQYADVRKQPLFVAAQEMGLEHYLDAKSCEKLRQFGGWIERLSQESERIGIQSLVERILNDTGYEMWLSESSKSSAEADRRSKNLGDFNEWLGRLASRQDDEHDIASVVNKAALLDILDRQSEEADDDRVQMLTLHAAKGLEFPHVFMVGMEEELLPHKSSIDSGDIEEERRLAYVGITRAQRTLTFTLALKRQRQGEIVEREPSRFISEIPAEDLEWEGEGCAKNPEESKSRGKAHLDNLRQLLN